MTARADGDDTTITVFILDDHEIVRRGLIDLLESHPRMRVVGEAGTATERCTACPAVRPDVALLDVRLPDGSGVDVCRDIRSLVPDTRCLMLTSFDDDDALFAAVMAGASGYLLKQIRGSSLTDAIEEIAAGRSLIDTVLDRETPAAAPGTGDGPRTRTRPRTTSPPASTRSSSSSPKA